MVSERDSQGHPEPVEGRAGDSSLMVRQAHHDSGRNKSGRAKYNLHQLAG
ncbi:MAG: hypothetical protein JWR05_2712 [Mucilaginibacter sp.]|nr:hypothetical protein [Mucilaginibacter sp.]